MKVGDIVKVTKDNHLTNEYYIGLIGEVIEILDKVEMNVKVKFKFKDNEKHEIGGLVNMRELHFDTDELKTISS